MRVIAAKTLVAFYTAHPETKASLVRWLALTKAATWNSMEEVKTAFNSAVVLNGERARFGIAGGNYRLIAAYDFRRKIAFVKFIGTHAEYDRIDALKVSQF